MNTSENKSSHLAVVTGAAKRLGKCIAIELASMGYSIGLHYHNSFDAASALYSQLTDDGIQVVLLTADLTRPSQIMKMFSEIKKSGHSLKVFINSASAMKRGTLQNTSVAEWDHMMNLNLRAAWLCIHYASQIMSEGGHIINITDSGAGRLWTNYAAYSISKSGLEVLTRIAAKSLAPDIRVNAIAPGLILPPENMENIDWNFLVNKLPLKKSGIPEDVAKAARYLIQSEHITGHTLVVDGGYRLISP